MTRQRYTRKAYKYNNRFDVFMSITYRRWMVLDKENCNTLEVGFLTMEEAVDYLAKKGF